MADNRRKIWDKKTNERRNEKKVLITFNMNKNSDKILYEEFLKIKEIYQTSDNQTMKNLILEKMEK